ncbi:MAG: GNAT family N-acetyltransferase [Nocardioidaceae bacterium]|nr:GNAT family N-acetyltransferase [Nocardioidaceae bacterium]
MRAGQREPSWHADFPRQDDLDGVSMIRDDSCWSSRRIVRAFDGLVVGSIGFFGPPEPAGDGVEEVEVGYGLVDEARGRGVATEALRGLLALTDAAGVRVRASVEPENAASIRVLAKCGFTILRGSDDEGNLVMARPLTARPVGSSR